MARSLSTNSQALRVRFWALADVRWPGSFDDIGQHKVAGAAACDTPDIRDAAYGGRRQAREISLGGLGEVRGRATKRTLCSQPPRPGADGIILVKCGDLRHNSRPAKLRDDREEPSHARSI